MPRAKRKRSGRDDALAPYRKIRKPMPPPEKVIGDRRRELDDEDARRQIEESTGRRDTAGDDDPARDDPARDDDPGDEG